MAHPEIILIETIALCNRTCKFCSWGQDRPISGRGSRMDWSLIKSIARQLSSIDFAGRISPFLINEPLLDDRLAGIIKLFRDSCPKAYLSIATNGDLLTPGKAQELIAAGLDAIAVSWYGDLRQTWLFEPHDLPITLLDRTNPIGFVENRGGNIAGMAANNLPCHRPDTMLAIKSTGEVVLCCGDLYGDVVMGDLNQFSIESVWMGDRFVERREYLQYQRRGLSLCDRCSHSGRSSPVIWPSQKRR
jgi:MoaA/NifB/PqqE/SkfB family radical SAM enzyme